MNLTLCAPCLFGLESILSGEVRRIGGENIETADGRVTFTGDLDMVARANLRLRTAERVCIVLGSFEAKSFAQLFDQTVCLPFEEFIGKKDAFPVKGWSLKSGLHSIPDCQSIIKKAAVKRLERAYGLPWFEETGPLHQIQFSIYKDQATIMLDTSGAGLHKRGYRAVSTEAPIKETLAAGIADLARVRGANLVMDPMCGSGTLLIESALRAFEIAPGLRRRFSAENWAVLPGELWQRERDAARAEIDREKAFRAMGSDLDKAAVSLTADNAKKAGVAAKLQAVQRDLADFRLPEEDVTILCNPPYGERLLELQAAEALYRTMGRVFPKRQGAGYYIISPHENFEELFGRKADKRRKLYNGMIRCQLFMYFNQRDAGPTRSAHPR